MPKIYGDLLLTGGSYYDDGVPLGVASSAALTDYGTWDASAGTFPGAGAAVNGALYRVSVAGTVDSIAFTTDDLVYALTDNASTTTYASNWRKIGGGAAGGLVYQSDWDASAGTFPGTGTAATGHLYRASVAGVVGGILFNVGDHIYAITDNASTTVFAANWLRLFREDAVVTLTPAASAGVVLDLSVVDTYLGKAIRVAQGDGTPMSITLADDLPADFHCTIQQTGTAEVTIKGDGANVIHLPGRVAATTNVLRVRESGSVHVTVPVASSAHLFPAAEFRAQPRIIDFVAGDWVNTGTEQTITIAAATHGLDAILDAQVYEASGNGYIVPVVALLLDTATQQIVAEITIGTTPFAGKLVLWGGPDRPGVIETKAAGDWTGPSSGSYALLASQNDPKELHKQKDLVATWQLLSGTSYVRAYTRSERDVFGNLFALIDDTSTPFACLIAAY